MTVNLPAEVKQPLVVLFKNSDRTAFKVFDVHPDAFPFGSLKVFNGSGASIDIKLADTFRSVKAGSTTSFTKDIDFENAVWLRMKPSQSNSPF